MLKASGPAMLLEDYETMLSTSTSRGEAYRRELEESEVELATMGIDLDGLRPGEAREARKENEYLARKRGWRDSVVQEWTRAAVV